jgi:hypothetical protein
MSNCAVCQLSDGLVVNIIVAEPTEPAYEGTQLVLVPDVVMSCIGWAWDGTAFIDPNPPPVETPVETPVEIEGAPA